MSAYGVDRCDPLEQLQMGRIHGEYGRKDKSPGALFPDWVGVRPSPCQNPLPARPFQARPRWVTKVCMIALMGALRLQIAVVSPYAFPERQLSHADLNRSNDLHWLSIG